jgi:hypothetical protein
MGGMLPFRVNRMNVLELALALLPSPLRCFVCIAGSYSGLVDDSHSVVQLKFTYDS